MHKSSTDQAFSEGIVSPPILSIILSLQLFFHLKIVMRPQADNLHGLFFFQYFIDKPMLDIDSPGIGPLKISNQLFIRWGGLIGVFSYHVYQGFCLFIQLRRLQVRYIRCRLFGVNDGVHYHSTSFSGKHSSSGVCSPSMIFSRCCGIEDRYTVSIKPL